MKVSHIFFFWETKNIYDYNAKAPKTCLNLFFKCLFVTTHLFYNLIPLGTNFWRNKLKMVFSISLYGNICTELSRDKRKWNGNGIAPFHGKGDFSQKSFERKFFL